MYYLEKHEEQSCACGIQIIFKNTNAHGGCFVLIKHLTSDADEEEDL